MNFSDDLPASQPSLLSALVFHYDELIGYVRRRFGDRGFARDVIHDVCIKVMERPAVEPDAIRAPLALLRRISHDAAVDRCRADDTRRALIDSVEILPEAVCPTSDLSRALSAQQELDLLIEAIEALPERRRQVFILHKIHELPQAEVAARMAISLKMVEKQLRLGMAACRQHLESAMAEFRGMSDEARAADSTPILATTSTAQLLDRHRDLLRDRFPLPSAEQLAPRRVPKKKIVAALMLAFAVGLVWLDPAYHTQHFTTAIGERRQVQLADGTQLTLNTGTQLDIAWHLRSRRAVLIKGQALFDVSHAIVRPFYVAAGATQIRVVGTAFDVRHDNDAVAVTVLRGKVAVGSGDTQVLLVPDQRVDSQAGTLSVIKHVDAATNTAWKDGQLVFERTPLRDVLAELQRYTESRLTVDDPLLAAMPVSGVFGTDHGDTLLALLPRVLPVALEHTASGDIRVVPAH